MHPINTFSLNKNFKYQKNRTFTFNYSAKINKKRNSVILTHILACMVFKNIEKYMLNECIRSRLSFAIYFFMFCENHSCQNLSQNDAFMLFTHFCTIIKYRWPNV